MFRVPDACFAHALCLFVWHGQWSNVQPRIVSFILYALIFLAGRFGMITLSLEQIIYAYCDSTVKAGQVHFTLNHIDSRISDTCIVTDMFFTESCWVSLWLKHVMHYALILLSLHCVVCIALFFSRESISTFPKLSWTVGMDSTTTIHTIEIFEDTQGFTCRWTIPTHLLTYLACMQQQPLNLCISQLVNLSIKQPIHFWHMDVSENSGVFPPNHPFK